MSTRIRVGGSIMNAARGRCRLPFVFVCCSLLFLLTFTFTFTLAMPAEELLSDTAAASAAAAAVECPIGCPRIFDPVCGVDNTSGDHKYFHNDCLLRFENCHSDIVWEFTQMTFCLDALEPVVRAECVRPCHFIYDPVCASVDGKHFTVFGNDCVFGMENCLANEKWNRAQDIDCGL